MQLLFKVMKRKFVFNPSSSKISAGSYSCMRMIVAHPAIKGVCRIGLH